MPGGELGSLPCLGSWAASHSQLVLAIPSPWCTSALPIPCRDLVFQTANNRFLQAKCGCFVIHLMKKLFLNSGFRASEQSLLAS